MPNPGDRVHMEYIRPGKETTYYEEDFVSQNDSCLRTRRTLPPEIIERLSRALQEQKLIASHQQVGSIAKTYFFAEPFNLLEFRDLDGNLLGHYSDIGTPAVQLTADTYQMTDLYLDIWLFPDGRLLELDWDEFEEALQKGILSAEQAEFAKTAMERIVREVEQGVYPKQYL